jgi:hypothetical protein
VVKLKDTHTGNTLCTAKNPVTLSKVVYPKPNIHAALVAKVKGEEDKIASGLAALHEEDPTFLYFVDANCTRPSFPRRANCIWRSWPTVCAAGTTSMLNSPSRA